MKWALYFMPMCFAVLAGAQTAPVIPLSQEPHHHLALHNDYVNVYRVEVSPGDTVLLHRHDFDAISVMIDDAQVTVHTPDKPDAHQKLSNGQIRLQPKGYVHSTSIDEDSKPYRNVTVELLIPQQGERNLCAVVIAGQPLNCPATPSLSLATHDVVPQLETSEARVDLMRVRPRQSVDLGSASEQLLIVALDDAVIASTAGGGAETPFHAGDFVWLKESSASRVFRNPGAAEARFVMFSLKPIK
jgi:hypothetical protein